ncbi:conserved hypothetical protein [Uncinocarpus reesii 1704]|uniref:NADPH-dependent diflavin oxidoreductase 1 n=1 Tax=Uncinocarpus reesii (strain UAMH 1704) TaxID=336963 RepID=C4JN94_UNCRE|nr:uncharacterized protein UREG_04300 [Uncinocarpus reesii 1704]EEP79454.1 conserved hypothetical protein [Uncinocarpus reesii 1704]
MATYGQRYLKKARTLPKLSAIPFEMNFFPKELWSTVDPKYVGLPGANGFGALSRAGQKRGFEDDEEDEVVDAARKRRTVDEGEDEGSDVDRRRDTDDEGGLEEEGEGEEEIVDDDFEDDEEDMGGDYNAEQYFDAGDEGDDYGDGDGGDGDGGVLLFTLKLPYLLYHFALDVRNNTVERWITSLRFYTGFMSTNTIVFAGKPKGPRGQSAEMAYSENGNPRTALVIYASETGNSQEIAEELGRLTERLHFHTYISELDAVKAGSLNEHSFVIFAISTTGQGDLPANGRTFWRSLLLKRLSSTYLHHVNFAIFGLGDSSYPKTDGTFVPWAQNLRKFLLDKFPLEPGQHPIPDDVGLLPKWVLTTWSPSIGEPGQTVNGDGTQLETDSENRKGAPGRYPALQSQDHDTRPIPNSISATLVDNIRATPKSHWQDVRHLILTVPECLKYVPGDVLHITPKNFSDDVDALISLMGWETDADVPLCFAPRDPSSPSSMPPPTPFLQDNPGFTLRELLTNYLDIMAIPRRSFFSQVAHFTTDAMHKERLLEFTNPEYIDEYYDYATRSRRSILEVLYEFDTIKIPWQNACTVFPILRGRQFSIASGGKLKRTADGETRFDLLVAIVKYQTVIKKIREGICTRYLAILQPGSTLKVQLHRGGLNPSAKQLLEPSVLIGPGTGVAPIRSLLWEKAALAEAYRHKYGSNSPLPIGPIILLYGGRNRGADFFFEKDWEELKETLDLTVLSAFSRDQRQKHYVQDVIRQKKDQFFNVLHDLQGTVFICGSSGRMPQAVREALIETFEKPGSNRQEAEKYLMDMEKVGRYRQETW